MRPVHDLDIRYAHCDDLFPTQTKFYGTPIKRLDVASASNRAEVYRRTIIRENLVRSRREGGAE